jgi:hypothetical protein
MPIVVLPEDRPPGALLAALRADSMCTFVCLFERVRCMKV